MLHDFPRCCPIFRDAEQKIIRENALPMHHDTTLDHNDFMALSLRGHDDEEIRRLLGEASYRRRSGQWDLPLECSLRHIVLHHNHTVIPHVTDSHTVTPRSQTPVGIRSLSLFRPSESILSSTYPVFVDKI